MGLSWFFSEQVLFQSFVWKNQLQFVMTLREKGFEFPFKMN